MDVKGYLSLISRDIKGYRTDIYLRISILHIFMDIKGYLPLISRDINGYLYFIS